MYHQYMDTFSQVRRPGRPTAPVGSPVEYYYYLKYPGTGVRLQDLMLEEKVFDTSDDKVVRAGCQMALLIKSK